MVRAVQTTLRGLGAAVRARPGTVLALVGVAGRSTGPCSVVGCGAPVLPVVGLVFAGLSSGTLVLLSGCSRVSSAVAMVALTVVVAWLGRHAGSTVDHRPASR